MIDVIFHIGFSFLFSVFECFYIFGSSLNNQEPILTVHFSYLYLLLSFVTVVIIIISIVIASTVIIISSSIAIIT